MVIKGFHVGRLLKEAGKYLLLGALLAYLFFGVLRPMLRQLMEARPAPELEELPAPSGGGLIAARPGQPGDQLHLARKLAREDPKVVANVVKSWVTKDE